MSAYLACILPECFTLKGEFDSFSTRHPCKTTDEDEFKASLASRQAKVRYAQEAQLKKALLKTEIHIPAPDFKLQDLAGTYVTLADYQGKTLILVFWATWCAPCVEELKEVETAYEKYQNDPKVSLIAISVDNDKHQAALFAKQKGYEFPILLRDEKIQDSYKTAGIPKLFVIDETGYIRFEHVGYEKDGYFLKKLNWMIAAASR